MHPRSPYFSSGPDFARLILRYPALGAVAKNGTIDFKHPLATREVTKCLLLHDFDLKLDLPDDRLSPPVPNRLNYVLWLEDLVSETRDAKRSPAVVGVDIGTGASAIYPLLACRQNDAWTFYALESDPESLAWASKNVLLNNFQDRITVVDASSDDPHILTQHALFHEERPVTFTMCNPPFYASKQDMHDSEVSKRAPANGSCAGSEGEMITPGGEVAFILSHITDSIALGDKVQWYTTMCGKSSTVAVVVDALKTRGITNYAVTEFAQGQTKRWGVAWSFMPWRPLPETSRHAGPILRDLSPVNPAQVMVHGARLSHSDIFTVLVEFLEAHHLEWSWITVKASIEISVLKNTWSRQARRKLAQQQQQQQQQSASVLPPPEDEHEHVKLRARITVEHGTREIEVLWRYGLDFLLFESFCAKLKQVVK